MKARHATTGLCCSVEDVFDAKRVSQKLDMPHYVLNLEEEFRKHVIEYFIREYKNGRTPHPCIACNDKIKFAFFLQRALSLEADWIAHRPLRPTLRRAGRQH